MMILPPVCMHAFATRAYTGVEMIMEYTGDSCTKNGRPTSARCHPWRPASTA